MHIPNSFIRSKNICIPAVLRTPYYLCLLSFSFLIFFFNLFIFGCVGSSLLRAGPLQLLRAGAIPRRGARASHFGGLFVAEHGLQVGGPQQLWLSGSRVQAQQLWRRGPAAPPHMGSSRTRARTRVPCVGRWTLNHCATRGVPMPSILMQTSLPLS